MKKIYSIIPTKLYAILEHNYQFIDLRSPSDYQRFHLKNFQNIPASSLLQQLPSLNTSLPIILLCYSGRVAKQYAPLLTSKGFEVYIVEGGINSVLYPIDEQLY